MNRSFSIPKSIKSVGFVAAAFGALCFVTACGDDQGDNIPGGNNPPSGQGTTIRTGALTNVLGTPSATGSMRIEVNPSGKRFLILEEDFQQEIGPGDTEIRVAASAENLQVQIDADPNTVSPVIGIVPNGGSGSFTFEVPASVDLDALSFVVVWCPTAAVNFGTGQLRTVTRSVLQQTTLINVEGTPSATGPVTIEEDSTGARFVVLGDSFSQEMGPGDTELRFAFSDGNISDQLDADPGYVSPVVGVVPNGASGSFEFSLPPSVDLNQLTYVVIWCPTAAVNFGVGRLSEI
jgi:hypothetical protein